MSKAHKLCRPPRGAKDVLRLATNGRWVEDDGKPGLAFSGHSIEGYPMAWSVDCDCALSDGRCPADKALHKTCDRYGCANGDHVLATRLQSVRKP